MSTANTLKPKEQLKISASKRYQKRSQGAEIWRRLKKNKGAMVGLAIVVILALIAIFADVILDYDAEVIKQNIPQRMQLPSREHILGTDEVGRDVFFRLLYGTRFSLSVGIVAVAIALAIGVVLGSIAGYFGGVTEEIIMRATDIFASIPNILMGIVIVAALGASTVNLMIAVGISSVPQFIRVTRAAVLTVRYSDYIIPNCLSPIIVQTTLRVASAIISASALSFLGLGVPQPSPEWGSMLSSGRQYIRTNSLLTFFPGLAIMITVLALNLLGDGLRDALDPKLRR